MDEKVKEIDIDYEKYEINESIRFALKINPIRTLKAIDHLLSHISTLEAKLSQRDFEAKSLLKRRDDLIYENDNLKNVIEENITKLNELDTRVQELKERIWKLEEGIKETLGESPIPWLIEKRLKALLRRGE